MRRLLLAFCFTLLVKFAFTQDSRPDDPAGRTWKIKADKIDPSNYYGITVANGMIGIVSSPEPFKVKDVVLAGAYDLYGRGRVSNFLRSFNLLNMYLDIDGKRVDAKNISNFQQRLDMHHAAFTTSFDYGDKATVQYTYYSLRHLPFTVLMDISITAKKDISITGASVMEAPDALRDVQNYYNEIDRPHVVISLLTSSAKSPTGKLWMFPALLVLHPEMAKSMIEYRYQRLDAAKRNAFSHGYKGAMYPWESAETGVEETPVWALSGPFEHHITADVALAAWNYYCVTQDKQWLKEKGWPIISATADFWTSRVERNGPGKYEIKNVVAADEWAENVDNNAFTNAAAKANLNAAAAAAKILNVTPGADWQNVANNIPILKLDN